MGLVVGFFVDGVLLVPLSLGILLSTPSTCAYSLLSYSFPCG